MAVNENLMNTQTGGEGETVQIQTQEPVTPEQFDVNIKAQETPAEETPVEPPVQRQMTEPEVISAESTGGIADQEAFQGEVPALPGIEPTMPPSEEIEEDLEFAPYESPVDSEEDQDLPFSEYEDPFSFDSSFKNFKTAKEDIDNQFKNSELGDLISRAEEDEQKNNTFLGKAKDFFKKKQDTYEGVTSPVDDGDEVPDEELAKLGEKLEKNPSVDPSKNLTEQGLVPEEVKDEDLTDIIDKESVIGQVNTLISEQEQLKAKIKNAQGETLKTLRGQLKSVRQNIKQLKQGSDLKEEKDTYKEKALSKGYLPADFYSSQKESTLGNIMPTESKAKNNFSVKKPLAQSVSDSIFGSRIKSGDMSSMDANNILYGLFVSPSKKAYYGDPSVATKMAIYGVDDEGKKTHKALTYEEVLNIDRTFRSVANWAKENGGKTSDGKYRASLFPAFGNLPTTTVEVFDKNKTLRKVTLFEGIYDSDEERKAVKNGYGSQAAFKGEKDILITPTKRDYFVPDAVIKGWEKNLKDKGFRSSVFKQQQRLARLKDEEGKPYLQSEKGLFGVGITGFMDEATAEAQKRLDDDIRFERSKKGTVVKGDIKLKTGSDFGLKSVISFNSPEEWKKSGLTYGKYNVKNIPVELMRSTPDAIAWANNHLATGKEVNFENPNVFEQGQDNFKKYIDGLGLNGVTVKPLGAWYVGDFDYVRLDGNGGSLIIDLNEGDNKLNTEQLKRLNDWVKVAQDDPRSEFIEHFTNSFDKDYAVSKRINKESGLGNKFTLSFQNQAGKTIDITNKDGQLETQNYLNEIEFQNAYNQEIKENAESKLKSYNESVRPAVSKFKSIQDQSEISINALEKELNEFDNRLKTNQISQEDFTTKANEINNKIVSIQDNLLKSYDELQGSVGNNKPLLDQINKDFNEVETANINLSIISQDIKDLAAIETARVMADNTGPRTTVGHIAGAISSGYMKPFIATVSAASDVLISLGVHPEGMTKEEAFKMNNDWKTDFLYGELSNALKSSLGMKMSKGYESRLSFPGQAVYGAIESVGTQANPFVRILKGTPLQGAASTLGFASQSYTQIEEEILKNPELKDLPEYQKKLIAIPYAMGMSLIDKWGYGKLTGGKSSMTQKVMVSVINQALKRVPKNATLETIEAVIKGDIKSNAAKFVLATNRAAISEFETEGIQAAAFDVGLKELSDNMLGLDAFNKGSTFDDYVKLVLKNAAMGYIGGAALGGAMRSVEFAGKKRIDMINPEDYDFFKIVANDSELKKTFAAELANKFSKREISKQEFEDAMINLEELNALDKKVSDTITGKDRLKMVDLLYKKQQIQERMKGLDESQQSLPDEEYDKVNKEIESIVNSTAERIKKQQEYDKEDEQRVSSEVGEEQESIETQPIVEASQEEVSPGGMVQEEQTEVTPTEEITTTEEVETEPEKTTTTETITGILTTGQTQVESDLIGQDVSTGKQRTTEDIQTGETVSKFEEGRNPTKGKVVNVEADPRNKNIERLILEDGTVLNRNKNTGAITLNNQVKATAPETTVTATTTNEFDELAGINSMSPAKKVKAMKAFNEKYGDKAERITKIDSKFTSIVNKLVSNNVVKKKC